MTDLQYSGRIIISGGGTGGHVFPALAIAHALKAKDEQLEILFVGAKNRLEMDKVPEAGFNIIGLPVEGFIRKPIWKNFKVFIKLLNSLSIARQIVRRFGPHAVVGVGGYASYPVLRVAGRRGVPTFILEQNSFAGVANRWLAGRARKIFVAHQGMDRFFPAHKLVMTGNPVRPEIEKAGDKPPSSEDYRSLGLEPDRTTLLILGGSLGAANINKSIESGMDEIREAPVQVIWQCGKYYYKELKERVEEKPGGHIHLMAFIDRMDQAYRVANLIVSRAGAITLSELSHVGKAVILVPSPNVAEDHQTKNARALVAQGAALHIPDRMARKQLVDSMLELAGDEEKQASLGRNIRTMARKDSAGQIANEILSYI